MFVVLVGENKFIDSYKEYLKDLNLDFSNVISPKDFSPLYGDVFNDYLLKRADAVVIFTPSDQFNFYIAKVCKDYYKIKKVISVINNSNNADVFNSIGVKELIDWNYYAKNSLYNYLKGE